MANPGYKPTLLQEALDAVTSHGTVTAAARVLGIPYSTLENRYKTAVARNFEPQCQALIVGDQAAPGPGMALKGTSTLYGEDGKAKLQWVKTSADQQRLEEAQRAALAAMCEEIKPLAAIRGPRHADKDLATLYTLTDSHIGALCWNKETGADWDLSIAESTLVETCVQMINAAPDSAVGIVNELGDFLHTDSLLPTTPTSHHVLDADSRYQKIVTVAVRVLRRVIEHALTKHAHVQVQLKEGNHDPSGSVWLRVMMAQLYENNPRVTIDMSPNPYTTFEHGKTLLGFYHGHLTKKANLGELFAAQFREQWGRCEFVYIHTGHLHNHEEQERRGCKLIQHATLAAPDAYAARGGWLSKRQVVSMTYSKQAGEVSRAVFIPKTVNRE